MIARAGLRVLEAAAIGTLILSSLNCGRSASNPQSDIVAVRDTVRQMLDNPIAGRFRDGIVMGNGDARIVCGEVDDVNESGAYVGFRTYAYLPELHKAEVYCESP